MYTMYAMYNPFCMRQSLLMNYTLACYRNIESRLRRTITTIYFRSRNKKVCMGYYSQSLRLLVNAGIKVVSFLCFEL